MNKIQHGKHTIGADFKHRFSNNVESKLDSSVGFPREVKFNPASINMDMRSIFGSIIGGAKQTQGMLDFCASHKIYPEVEVVPIQYVNEALERMIKKDVKFRFVIDVANSLK